jgi:cytochrome bd ubiquinol oxidase subunit II
METASFLQNAWFLLIGVLLAGYSVLDGFDLGIGVLFPFLARSEDEKRALLGAIGPVWDGNEVWLLAGGGALFAAFPAAYATVFSGFYLALMLVLFALILRAVSLEFRAHDPARKGFWEAVFVASSFLPALLLGVALGNVVAGVPLDARGEFAGTFFTLLRPWPLAVGVLGLCVFLLHGSAYAALKTDGPVRERARRAAKLLAGLVFAALFAAFLLVLILFPRLFDRIPSWLIGNAVCLCCALFLIALRKGRDGLAFFFSSAIFVGLWGVIGAIHYPNLVRATDPALSLTVANASSSPLALKIMLVIALVGMPVVVGYTVFAYRVFKGKARPGEAGY